jgi:uncharacterized protein (DUF433 family)
MKQRDMMRELLRRLAGDRAQVIAAYATAERGGEVHRSRDSRNMTAEDYAARLFADGVRKGWIREWRSPSGAQLRLDHHTLHNQLSHVDYSRVITMEPGKRSGKPCIRGMRITVQDILEYLAGGMTEREILHHFSELTREDIKACLAFAADRERKLFVAATK